MLEPNAASISPGEKRARSSSTWARSTAAPFALGPTGCARFVSFTESGVSAVAGARTGAAAAWAMHTAPPIASKNGSIDLPSTAGSTASCLDRFILQIGRKPLLGFGNRHCLAARVILDLVAPDFSDREVARLRVRQVEAGHRRGGQHGAGLRQADAGVPLSVEQREQRALLGMVRAGGVAGRGPDAAVSLGNELCALQPL